MSPTCPNCRRCGRPYSTPGGAGYCEEHRQFPLCTACDGRGWFGSDRRCERCQGTRHASTPRPDFVHVEVPVAPVNQPAPVPDFIARMYSSTEPCPRLPGESRQEWRRRARGGGS